METALTEDQVLSAIEAEKDYLVSLTQKVLSIPSVNPPGDETPVAQLLENELKQFGFSTELIEFEPNRANLIARLRGKKGTPKLCMYAHMDVVPPGDLKSWSVDPFAGALVGDKLIGRGAVDHKFPLPALTVCAKVFKQLGLAFDGDLLFVFTADEERGSFKGLLPLLEKRAFEADMGIYAGPTSAGEQRSGFAPWFDDFNIINASNGCIQYRIIVHGKLTHTMSLELGVNPITKTAKLVLALQELADDVNKRTDPHTGKSRMSVNIIKGGFKENMVPDSCEILVDRRINPTETAEQATAEIQAVIDKLKQADPALNAEVVPNLLMPAVHIREDEELIKIVKKAGLRVKGKEPKAAGILGSTDMAWFVKYLKVPSVAFGYADLTMCHQPNEFITVQDLVDSAKAYALIMMEILKPSQSEA